MNGIPKKIHYCWFGRGKKSDLIKKCIKSWEKYMPDYEIIEWNEDNFEFENSYVKEAYKEKKYAFVSDYVRLKVVFQEGGIYLDTDVELIKSLEPLLCEGGFMGFERTNTVSTGLGFAAKPKDKIIEKMLSVYDNLHFILDEDGRIDQTPCPVRNTEALKSFGISLNNTKQKIGDIIIYPKEYFCPLDYDSGKLNITGNTYSIHHCGYSWADSESIKILMIKRKIFKFFPAFFAQKIFDIVNHVYRWGKRYE